MTKEAIQQNSESSMDLPLVILTPVNNLQTFISQMGKLQVLTEKRQVTANFNFQEYFVWFLYSPPFSSGLHFEWHLRALCLSNFS